MFNIYERTHLLFSRWLLFIMRMASAHAQQINLNSRPTASSFTDLAVRIRLYPLFARPLSEQPWPYLETYETQSSVTDSYCFYQLGYRCALNCYYKPNNI